MAQENPLANLPTGKEDRPICFGMTREPFVYDMHDIDGLMYMLDHALSGCLVLTWAKQMDPSVPGRIRVDGRAVEHYVLKPMAIMHGMWIVGIPLRGIVTEPGRTYTLHMEGFTDTDGNEMLPRDFQVIGKEQVLPDPKDAAHEAVARQAAAEGIVLLKNEKNVLPLPAGTAINLFGKGVWEFRDSAVGAGKINPRYHVSLVDALRGEKDYPVNEELLDFYRCDEDRIPDRDILARAKAKSDLAIMLLTRASGENMDNASGAGEFNLTPEEDALIRTLSETFSRTIVILNVGYPINVTFAKKYHVSGLLYNGFGGMLAGRALMDVLKGAENPSGKLPDTWALDWHDIPSSQNFYDAVDKPRLDADSTNLYVDTVYEEGIYVGYRYFTTFGKPCAYPFGFGLSYTQFVIEPGEASFDGHKLQVRAIVRNMGARPGKEVLQIYVGKPNTLVENPEKELVFFQKTRLLKPKEEEIIEAKIPVSHLASYVPARAAYIAAEGSYRVYVGNSAEALPCASFAIADPIVTKKVTNLFGNPGPLVELSKKHPESTFPKGAHSGVVEGKESFLPYAARKTYPAVFTGSAAHPTTFADVRKDLSRVEDYVAAFSTEELARLVVCASAGWGQQGVGEAGRVFRPEQGHGSDLPDFPVSDGNSGVNLRIPNIGMPSGATICATFNRPLCEEVGKVIGEEARALHMPMILAPAFNIHRNPLCGRQPEYFSEDPFLAGEMAGWYTKGLESTGVAACIKHFAVNNAETARKRNQSVVSERTLRDIYLRAFAYCMEVHMPAAVMTAYNACNGRPTSADPDLIQGFLRKENGFDGFVMTDWGTYDTVDVAEMVKAGISWITPGSLDDTYTAPIVRGVQDGTIPLARLQENAAQLVRTIARFA